MVSLRTGSGFFGQDWIRAVFQDWIGFIRDRIRFSVGIRIQRIKKMKLTDIGFLLEILSDIGKRTLVGFRILL
jgi:hypothetical protein